MSLVIFVTTFIVANCCCTKLVTKEVFIYDINVITIMLQSTTTMSLLIIFATIFVIANCHCAKLVTKEVFSNNINVITIMLLSITTMSLLIMTNLVINNLRTQRKMSLLNISRHFPKVRKKKKKKNQLSISENLLLTTLM